MCGVRTHKPRQGLLWLSKPKYGLVTDNCLKPASFKASFQEHGCVPHKKGSKIQVPRRPVLVPHGSLGAADSSAACTPSPLGLDLSPPFTFLCSGHTKPLTRCPVPRDALSLPPVALVYKRHERFKSYFHHSLTLSTWAQVFPICVMEIIKASTAKWDTKCES